MGTLEVIWANFLSNLEMRTTRHRLSSLSVDFTDVLSMTFQGSSLQYNTTHITGKFFLMLSRTLPSCSFHLAIAVPFGEEQTIFIHPSL